MYPAPAWRHGDKYVARWDPRRIQVPDDARYKTEILHRVKSKTPGSFGFGTESTFSITEINCLDMVISSSRLWSAIHHNLNCLILIGQGCARLITRQQSHAVN